MESLIPEKVRILVLEDDRDQREVLVTWLRTSGYVTLSAENGLEALHLLKQQSVDVILSDLKLPGLSGLQLLNHFKEADPSVIVIFLTGQGTMEDAIEALREWRAFDFMRKPLGSLRQLNLVIEKALLRRQTMRTAEAAGEPQALAAPRESLTARELELVRLLAQGHDTRVIADHLALSEKTVRNNLSLLYEKLGVKNRVQAVLACLQHSLV